MVLVMHRREDAPKCPAKQVSAGKPLDMCLMIPAQKLLSPECPNRLLCFARVNNLDGVPAKKELATPERADDGQFGRSMLYFTRKGGPVEEGK